MPGKYSHLKGQLTTYSSEPEYQDRVNAERERIKGILKENSRPLSAASYADFLIMAKLEKARLEALVKEQSLTIEAMSQELIDRLEGDSITALRLVGGIALSIKDDVYCSVFNKVEFHNWIREQHLEDLFTVHYQTMSAMTKQKLQAGEPIPPGIEPYFRQSIVVRGIKALEKEGAEIG